MIPLIKIVPNHFHPCGSGEVRLSINSFAEFIFIGVALQSRPIDDLTARLLQLVMIVPNHPHPCGSGEVRLSINSFAEFVLFGVALQSRPIDDLTARLLQTLVSGPPLLVPFSSLTRLRMSTGMGKICIVKKNNTAKHWASRRCNFLNIENEH